MTRSARFLPLALSAVLLLFTTGCHTLKPVGDQPQVEALAPATSGELARLTKAFSSRTAGRSNASGFHLITNNREALMWRLALIDEATTSIDAQYFIWQKDEAGRLMMGHMLSAAERGVRIRILVDDMGIAGSDKNIARLCQHPNIDIKLFNPGKVRSGKLVPTLEFLLYLKELNRRMHNKALIVDGHAAIIGGRNVGNSYFGLNKKYNFSDLDVLTCGAVVPQISDAFDEFWNSDPTYPGKLLADDISDAHLDELFAAFRSDLEKDRDTVAAAGLPIATADWRPAFTQLPARLHIGEASILQDEPVLHRGEQRRLLDTLNRLADQNESELLIVSPYLIPRGTFLPTLKRMSDNGVSVHILTGSLGSNNHTIVHSHYKKYRKPILETGAELHEFHHHPGEDVRAQADMPQIRAKFISLHNKVLVGDRRQCFIGSLNLDPRAMEINTENGLLIHSPSLGAELADYIHSLSSPENAWQVQFNARGKLIWTSSHGEQKHQPARTFIQRISDAFLHLLPVEDQV
ncbi:phospholipase D family protein [Sulfuriroseicoccus oceanibius]|uniref:Phospholipase D family protein n=1 Tax=Sulfuriroseicoccus oceanibius TaxID=2707525 RepID=A0A6B3L3L9_9BACT|nr:phospholipase D family protein [Sulfuriroseicoccus oceanibius]QQL44696.1 phospholipase D family protein [Sulfuriroseicoccus oceanibius]